MGKGAIVDLLPFLVCTGCKIDTLHHGDIPRKQLLQLPLHELNLLVPHLPFMGVDLAIGHQILVQVDVQGFCALLEPLHLAGHLLLFVGQLIDLQCQLHHWLGLGKHVRVHSHSLEPLLVAEGEHDLLVGGGLLGGQQGDGQPLFGGTGRPPAAMHVDLRVPGKLVVHHVRHVRDVHPTADNVSGHNDRLRVSLEPIQVLQTLPLLHLGMQGRAPDLKGVQDGGKPPDGTDCIDEDNGPAGIHSQEIVKVVVPVMVCAVNPHLPHLVSHAVLRVDIDDLEGLQGQPHTGDQCVHVRLLCLVRVPLPDLLRAVLVLRLQCHGGGHNEHLPLGQLLQLPLLLGLHPPEAVLCALVQAGQHVPDLGELPLLVGLHVGLDAVELLEA
mmetsp:Transcript_26877/g.48327  ORF Transcript_26877/g.48327 Transcript_26877/m.48327 type:complete len:383 (-) Transcript_26877:343-1491(-)